MKKVLAMVVIATTVMACGGSTKTEQTSDSTAVAVDSAVVTQDTTATPVVADSTVTK
jgi:hypothetical protein